MTGDDRDETGGERRLFRLKQVDLVPFGGDLGISLVIFGREGVEGGTALGSTVGSGRMVVVPSVPEDGGRTLRQTGLDLCRRYNKVVVVSASVRRVEDGFIVSLRAYRPSVRPCARSLSRYGPLRSRHCPSLQHIKNGRPIAVSWEHASHTFHLSQTLTVKKIRRYGHGVLVGELRRHDRRCGPDHAEIVLYVTSRGHR